MGVKKKFVSVKASSSKKRKTGFVRKQQRQIARMNQLKNGDSIEQPLDKSEDSGPSVEVKFAQRLAANDPKVREKAISKLRKWIQGSYRSLTEIDMLKLWKGLHYCFWMSDKPLLQEELAENISNIIHCFDTEKALLFFKCFLTTLGREWIGIDRWRTDKFMMFARRILRQALLFVMKKVNDDEEDVLNEFVAVCDNGVISAEDAKCAVGFKLHFTDIFMEELTKVNATFDQDMLTDDLVETLLEPFLRQIVQGEEVRLVDQIEERIFNHLIRQSDVALAYEEGSDDEDMEEQMNEEEEEGEDNDVEEGDDEDASNNFDLAASDPRAGVGDVCLPQLDLDYNRLAEVLLKAGGEASVGHQQRKRLYAMSKRFQLLANGIFPFAAELNDEGEVVDREEGIEDINVDKEIAKARREAGLRSEEAKKEREQFKQALKDKKAGKEPPPKPKKQEKKKEKAKKGNKEKSKERIEKFMEKQAQKAKEEAESKKVKKPKKERPETTDCDSSESQKLVDPNKKKNKVASEVTEQPETTITEELLDEPKIKKKKKKKNVNSSEAADKTESSANIEVAGDELNNSSKKSKKRKSPDHMPIETQPKKSNSVVEETEETSAFSVATKKKKISKKSTAPFEVDNGWGEPLQEGEFEVVEENPNYKGKAKIAPAAEAKKVKKKSEGSPTKKSEDSLLSPKISTPENLPKTQFFRKAVSKSAQKVAKKTQDEITMSEPAKKSKKINLAEKGRKLNFAMSQNKYQSLLDVDRSMQESPEIPFDAERMPAKGLLKVKAMTPTSTPKTSKKMNKAQSVMYNTMMNSKSPFAAKRRPVAADFF